MAHQFVKDADDPLVEVCVQCGTSRWKTPTGGWRYRAPRGSKSLTTNFETRCLPEGTALAPDVEQAVRQIEGGMGVLVERLGCSNVYLTRFGGPAEAQEYRISIDGAPGSGDNLLVAAADAIAMAAMVAKV